MGYFTFTLANREPKQNRHDYTSASKLKYDGMGCIICPDDTVIVEPCYEGYGMFDGKDVYDLVVDWNKGHLLEAVMRECRDSSKPLYAELAKAIDEGREADCQGIVQSYLNYGMWGSYMLTEWKRSLGIEIACGEANTRLPYPIKITNTPNPRKKYADLRPSLSCQ